MGKGVLYPIDPFSSAFLAEAIEDINCVAGCSKADIHVGVDT
jgi:hypothetical protein